VGLYPTLGSNPSLSANANNAKRVAEFIGGLDPGAPNHNAFADIRLAGKRVSG
jgi:hypothetical protein